MKILILNGSPKGEFSTTYHTLKYIEKRYPSHEYSCIPVGQTIGVLKKNIKSVIHAIEQAELIVFSYPVYTFLAPSQLHELIAELKKCNVSFEGKFATQITTSKHFYDMTAHRYIEENAKDLKFKFIKGLSADMDDLTTEKGQKQACDFFEYVMWCMKENIYESCIDTVSKKSLHLASIPEVVKKRGKDIVIITDSTKNDIYLNSMIERFQTLLPFSSRIVNLHNIRMDGGCLGCFQCAFSGKCIYHDHFDEILRNTIQNGDAMIYAFSVKDHSMGALFKRFDDRQFCNGHRTVNMGMPIGYLVSGELSKEENLRTIIEARCEVGSNFLCGIACDEFNPDQTIDEMVKKLTYALENQYCPPQNFYGIGGMKIFRDLIYLMQGMMRADHQFFKAHHQYDFPQKKKGTILMMYFVGAIFKNGKLRKKIGNKMSEGMIAPYKKIVDQAKPKY